MKSTMARALIKAYSSPGDMVCDPFVGSGVVALECLIAGRGVKTVDINPYAITLTMAKLYPPKTMEEALEKTSIYLKRMTLSVKKVTLDNIPGWTRSQ
jgi:DNA modification methylase